MLPSQYALLIAHAKSLTLKVLPSVFINFRDLCVPWVAGLTQSLLSLSQEACLKCGDLDTYFELLVLCRKLLTSFGIGAISIISEVVF